MQALWVGLGGGLGAVARYLLDGWVQRRLGTTLPWGTLIINLLGSFLLALLMVLALRTGAISTTLRVALSAGVLGGFTTYSTFNYNTLRYMQEGAWTLALLNVSATLLGCLGAGWLGWLCGRAIAG